VIGGGREVAEPGVALLQGCEADGGRTGAGSRSSDQYFAGLDAPGRKVSDQPSVCGQKVVSAEVFWKRPDDLFEHRRTHFIFRDGRSEKADLEFRPGARVAMGYPGDL